MPLAVNLGGPGWIADVCDVKILLDTDLEHELEPFEDVDEAEDDEVSGADRIPVCNAGAACRMALGISLSHRCLQMATV